MGDFIVGGKWYLLGGWVANPGGSDPEIYKKSGLKPKKLFQNLFQRWCLISTFNCSGFCNPFFAPSWRGCLAQLLEGAVAAQCSGRGLPSPGGMCWVLVPELTGLPWHTVWHHGHMWHLLQTEVTCTPQRAGWHLGCHTVHPPARPTIPPRCGADLEQPVWHQAPWVCLWEHCGWSWHSWKHDQQPSHLGWWQGGIPVALCGDQGQLPCGVHPHGCNPMHPKISERVGKSGGF